jgi:branched-chain amino acid transport system substrate-binding protein
MMSRLAGGHAFASARISLFASLATLTLSASAPTAFAQAAKGDPVKIGVTYPLSGPQGAWGQLLLPAIEISVAQRNEAGGINGRPIQIVVEDTKGTPDGGVSAMRKLVQVDGVPAILTIFTNVVSAQIPLARQFQVPIMSPVEAPGLVTNTQYAFAHSPLPSRTVPIVGEVWKKQNVKRIFAFYPNTPIIKFLSPIVKAEADKLGATYDEASFKLGDSDFRGLITRAKDFGPDAIFIMGHGTPDEGTIMKQIRELGMQTPLYGGCACITVKSYREAAGKAAEGLIYGGFKYDRAAAAKLIDAYRARMGFDPDYASLEAYDMINMIADSAAKNGLKGSEIREGLANLKGFKSIGGGLVDMNDNQTVISVGLYRVIDASKPEFQEITP